MSLDCVAQEDAVSHGDEDMTCHVPTNPLITI